MKRNLFAGLVLSLLASTSAFAAGGGGIGHAGSYNQPWWSQGSTTTRADVNAGTARSHGYSAQSANTGDAKSASVQGNNATNGANDQ
jgi:hypothetical protein